MPLVRRFTTANAIEQPKVPWYEPVVAYGLLFPGVLTWFVGVPVFLQYVSCAGSDDPRCTAAGSFMPSSTGSYTGILATAAVLYALAFAAAITTQFTVRKLFFPLVWLIAVCSTLISLLAYGVMSGIIGTPWGQLLAGG